MDPLIFLVHLRFFELASMMLCYVLVIAKMKRGVLRTRILTIFILFIAIDLLAIVIWVFYLKVALL